MNCDPWAPQEGLGDTLEDPGENSTDELDEEELEAELYSRIHFEPNYEVPDTAGCNGDAEFTVEEQICTEHGKNNEECVAAIDQSSVGDKQRERSVSSISDSSDSRSNSGQESKDAKIVKIVKQHSHEKVQLRNFLSRPAESHPRSKSSITEVFCPSDSRPSLGCPKVVIQIGSESESEVEAIQEVVPVSDSTDSVDDDDSVVEMLISEAFNRKPEDDSRTSAIKSSAKSSRDSHIEAAMAEHQVKNISKKSRKVSSKAAASPTVNKNSKSSLKKSKLDSNLDLKGKGRVDISINIQKPEDSFILNCDKLSDLKDVTLQDVHESLEG